MSLHALIRPINREAQYNWYSGEGIDHINTQSSRGFSSSSSTTSSPAGCVANPRLCWSSIPLPHHWCTCRWQPRTSPDEIFLCWWCQLVWQISVLQRPARILKTPHFWKRFPEKHQPDIISLPAASDTGGKKKCSFYLSSVRLHRRYIYSNANF